MIPCCRKRNNPSLQSAYASGAGNADFIDVLDSIQTLLNFELEQIRAARNGQQAAARLEHLMGGAWPPAQSETSKNSKEAGNP